MDAVADARTLTGPDREVDADAWTEAWGTPELGAATPADVCVDTVGPPGGAAAVEAWADTAGELLAVDVWVDTDGDVPFVDAETFTDPAGVELEAVTFAVGG